MSFYSYKNGNSEQTPGCIHGNPLEGAVETGRRGHQPVTGHYRWTGGD